MSSLRRISDVCAVSFDDVRAAAATLVHQPIQIVNLHPTRLHEIWDDMFRVADALGRRSMAAGIVADLQRRVADIARRSAAIVDRPRVVSIEWLDPIMIGGMWMPELIERAGGIPLGTTAGEHPPTLTRDQLLALDPDVVLINPSGFALDRTMEEISLLRPALLSALIFFGLVTVETFDIPGMIGLSAHVDVLSTRIYWLTHPEGGLLPDYGTASALAVLLLIVIFLVGLVRRLMLIR